MSTVAELIKHLQDLPPETEVRVVVAQRFVPLEIATEWPEWTNDKGEEDYSMSKASKTFDFNYGRNGEAGTLYLGENY